MDKLFLNEDILSYIIANHINKCLWKHIKYVNKTTFNTTPKYDKIWYNSPWHCYCNMCKQKILLCNYSIIEDLRWYKENCKYQDNKEGRLGYYKYLQNLIGDNIYDIKNDVHLLYVLTCSSMINSWFYLCNELTLKLSKIILEKIQTLSTNQYGIILYNKFYDNLKHLFRQQYKIKLEMFDYGEETEEDIVYIKEIYIPIRVNSVY